MGIISDGRTRDTVHIDTDFRMHTFATTQTEFNQAVKDGRAFIVNTGIVTLTSANESAVFYFVNNEKDPIIVNDLFLQAGASTDGVNSDIVRGDQILPTGGTIISEAKPLITANLNPRSNKTIDITAYKGDEGDTFTGQVFAVQSFFYTSQSFIQSTGTSVPKGGILAMTATPPVGNTSLRIIVSLTVYKQS